MQSARRYATYQDLLSLPEDQRAEIIAGEIIVTPAPLPRHARVQRTLGRFVGGPFDDDDGDSGPGGWWILPEVDVQLSPHDVVRPDLTGLRRERLPKPWDQRPILVTPDWICEIVSPSNVAQDRIRKRKLYAERGISFYWIVDPLERTLEALQLQSGRWVDSGSYSDSDIARIPPFDAIEIHLKRLFPPE